MKYVKFCITVFLVSLLFNSCSYQKSYTYEDVLSEYSKDVTISYFENVIVTAPKGKIKAGLIFYPGGLVTFESYLPLMAQLSQKGIQCYLVHMPSDFAFTNINAADKYILNPEISDWYIAGHSLGGAMAATYASQRFFALKGVILLAAYSTEDLSNKNLKVLSVFGSNDMVLNRTNYVKNKINLPSDSKEVIIEGGIHSYFGDYGFQKDDGIPSITRKEQQTQTVNAICSFIQ